MKITQYGFLALLSVVNPPLLAAESTISPGHYLAQVSDCAACHTASNGAAFAGGLKIETPLGAIWSTNITPDRQTGIGSYSYEDFARALREGKGQDGHNLYPAMPYTDFSKFDDRQLKDLYHYFMQEVPAVHQQNRASDITWPLNMRWPVSIWNLMFHHDGPFISDPLKSAEWNRGAWLVQGPGHCGACHTPRGIAYQEKGQDQNDPDFLTGGTVDGWHAPSLNGDLRQGLGRWSQQDIVDFLQSGQNGHAMAFGSMRDVVQQSTQHWTTADLNAVASYLKSLPVRGSAVTGAAVGGSQAGTALYQDSCSACHRRDGKGYSYTIPALAGNPALLGDDPSSLISIILYGSQAPVTRKAVTGPTMPGFGWRLTDEQVAELSNYVRGSWGNQATLVTAGQVKKLRKEE
ncbi:c-type cytochrome [Erwiniaceae bacterium CAU 1747]